MEKSKRKWIVFLATGAIIASIIAGVAVVFIKKGASENVVNIGLSNFTPPFSPPSFSPLGRYKSAAISCDAIYCSDIARDILKEGGSVADAAIGGLLCMGVIHSQSLGIGGGFFLTLYNATTGETKVLNARETAPAAAHRDMYKDFPENSTFGGLAVGIPGEIKGYWELHKNYGLLPWARLFEPTIKLCEDGFNVTKTAAKAMKSSRLRILAEPSLSEILVNPQTHDVWEEGDKMTRPVLAKTLRQLAAEGGDALYTGSLAKPFVDDLKAFGGIITLDDMKNYQVDWPIPVEVPVHGGFSLKTLPSPGSGILLGSMLRILGNHLPHPNSTQDYIRNYQRITETFKYTYAKRTQLGDPFDTKIKPIVDELTKLLLSDEYTDKIRNQLMDTQTNQTFEYYGAKFAIPDDHGTAHISIIGANGDAISVTSTVNLYFGAVIRSKSTGIIYNNEMDDFSSPNSTNYFGLPPSVNNFIKPGKRPMSSMAPSIFVDKSGRVRLVIGAAGGTKITTSVALISIHNLWMGMNIKEAMDEKRIHHQLAPMNVAYEVGFAPEIIEGLYTIGHNVSLQDSFGSITGGVERTSDGTLQTTFDFRKSGSISGY